MRNAQKTGMWVNKTVETYSDVDIIRQTCCRCHTPISFMDDGLCGYDYCPACGAPMANESPIDAVAAYFRNKPMRSPDDMPVPLNTNSIDTKWDAWMQEQWWYHANAADDIVDNPEGTRILRLRDRLLGFGGHEACMPAHESDIDAIMDRGQLWYGDRILLKRGEPSQCHSNAACYWNDHMDNTVLCTGYALSEDGLWRQHSWLVELRPRKNRIIETTVPRVAYFGFAMTDDEAEKFYECNSW